MDEDLPSRQQHEPLARTTALMIWGTAELPGPTLLCPRHDIAHIALGDQHLLAVSSLGLALSMGRNTGGQLGLGSRDVLTQPTLTEVPALRGERVMGIAAGASHSLFLTQAGCVYVCGFGGVGQLGLGEAVRSSVYIPQRLPPDALFLVGSGEAGDVPTAVAAGGETSFVVLSSGRAVAFGSNAAGQAGTGTSSAAAHFLPALVDSAVSQGSSGGIASIAVGAEHTLFVTRSGELWSTGNPSFGRLGLGDDSRRNRGLPARVRGALQGKTVVCAAAGTAHSIAITSDGEVYGFGDNSKYAVGYQQRPRSTAPVGDRGTAELLNPSLSSVKDTPEFSERQVLSPTLLSLLPSTQLQQQQQQQRSPGSTSPVSRRPMPTSSPAATPKVELSPCFRAVSCAAGDSHSIVCTQDGSVYTWGRQKDSYHLGVLSAGLQAILERAATAHASSKSESTTPASTPIPSPLQSERSTEENGDGSAFPVAECATPSAPVSAAAEALPAGVSSRLFRGLRLGINGTFRSPTRVAGFGAADDAAARIVSARTVQAGKNTSLCVIGATDRLPFAVIAASLPVAGTALGDAATPAAGDAAAEKWACGVTEWAQAHPQPRIVCDSRGAVVLRAGEAAVVAHAASTSVVLDVKDTTSAVVPDSAAPAATSVATEPAVSARMPELETGGVTAATAAPATTATDYVVLEAAPLPLKRAREQVNDSDADADATAPARVMPSVAAVVDDQPDATDASATSSVQAASLASVGTASDTVVANECSASIGQIATDNPIVAEAGVAVAVASTLQEDPMSLDAAPALPGSHTSAPAVATTAPDTAAATQSRVAQAPWHQVATPQSEQHERNATVLDPVRQVLASRMDGTFAAAEPTPTRATFEPVSATLLSPDAAMANEALPAVSAAASDAAAAVVPVEPAVDYVASPRSGGDVAVAAADETAAASPALAPVAGFSAEAHSALTKSGSFSTPAAPPPPAEPGEHAVAAADPRENDALTGGTATPAPQVLVEETEPTEGATTSTSRRARSVKPPGGSAQATPAASPLPPAPDKPDSVPALEQQVMQAPAAPTSSVATASRASAPAIASAPATPASMIAPIQRRSFWARVWSFGLCRGCSAVGPSDVVDPASDDDL